MLGDSVYFVTPDCNLVALDIKTGTEKWAKEFCSLEMMYYGSIAPVVVKDKLILGRAATISTCRPISTRAARRTAS